MMKKVLAMGLMGMGFVVAQGCAVEQGADEQASTASDGVVSTQCYSMQGINTTKASLAVAMGIELGRWDSLSDLVISGSKVVLKSGVTCVKNNCANTKAILGQQDYTVDQNVFQNTSYAGDLVASFGRQQNLITNYKQNSPYYLPPAHKLTLVGGPKDLGVGACGPHYIFQVNHLDGTPLTTWEGYTIANTLCYFGFNALGVGCGSNPFIAPIVTTNTTTTTASNGCPAGQTCIAIDPADGDNGTTTTTTAGSAPTYPMNRVYDPTNALLGTACTTTSGKVTKLVSRCSTTPSTCGYLYCQ
ncbi:MAG TPA: hypothetical protein VER11_05415 [Polyangiaceae bacterium]|nr:hypothetical protein [Polyangiaceae bacterium]